MMNRPHRHHRAWTIALGASLLGAWPALPSGADGAEQAAPRAAANAREVGAPPRSGMLRFPPPPTPPAPAWLVEPDPKPARGEAIPPATPPRGEPTPNEPAPDNRWIAPKVAEPVAPPLEAPALAPPRIEPPTIEPPANPPLVERPIVERPASRDPLHATASLTQVTRRAESVAREAFSLAQRGAYYTAKAEFIQSLRLAALALDARDGGAAHSEALIAGLRALEEADDFNLSGAQVEIDVSRLVRSHRTTALKDRSLAGVSALAAMQAYYQHAQERLADAGGDSPAGSLALYGLGKLHSAMAESREGSVAMGGAKAMVFHQAALRVDPQNYLASNELGVLLARYDDLAEARGALVRSVTIQPTAEAWHNLAVVHERLGEADLAQRARNELQIVSAHAHPPRAGGVQWVSPETFAALEPAPGGPRPAASQPAAPASPAARAAQAPPPPTRGEQRSMWQWWNEKR